MKHGRLCQDRARRWRVLESIRHGRPQRQGEKEPRQYRDSSSGQMRTREYNVRSWAAAPTTVGAARVPRRPSEAEGVQYRRLCLQNATCFNNLEAAHPINFVPRQWGVKGFGKCGTRSKVSVRLAALALLLVHGHWAACALHVRVCAPEECVWTGVAGRPPRRRGAHVRTAVK